MLTYHKYYGSKQCIRTIWMRHETSSDSGRTNNSMQFQPIEVQQALNWHAGFTAMQCLGFQACLTSTVTCTLRNCLFSTRAFITICSACTLGIGSWRKSDIICLWFVMKFRPELAVHQLNRCAETRIQIWSLRAILMELGSHNLF